MMPGSRKGADLRRDPRFALHTSSHDPDDDDPSAWPGDAKVSGRAIEVTDPTAIQAFAGEQEGIPPGGFELFRADIYEMSLVRVGDPPDHLVIESWREGEGVRSVKRA